MQPRRQFRRTKESSDGISLHEYPNWIYISVRTVFTLAQKVRFVNGIYCTVLWIGLIWFAEYYLTILDDVLLNATATPPPPSSAPTRSSPSSSSRLEERFRRHLTGGENSCCCHAIIAKTHLPVLLLERAVARLPRLSVPAPRVKRRRKPLPGKERHYEGEIPVCF